jgi:hypothetical protein
MFCPHCGAESSPELNYCNRCGGGLSTPARNSAPEPAPTAVSHRIAWAVGTSTLLLVILGLGVLLAAVSELSRGPFHSGDLVWIVLFGMLTIFGSVALLMRFWTRLLGVTTEQKRHILASRRQAKANELGVPTFDGALPAPPARSVTEHTTRTLEHSRK